MEFKQPLEALVDEDQPIPATVQSAIAHIEHTALQYEGLWRKPGSTRQMNLMIKETAANQSHFEWTHDKPIENVTGILSKFLKQIPGAIINSREVIEELLQHKIHLADVRAAIAKLDPNRRTLLRALVRHWHTVCVHSSHNKMSPDALSTCITMCLIDERSIVTDMQSAQRLLGLMRPIAKLIECGDILDVDHAVTELDRQRSGMQNAQELIKRLQLELETANLELKKSPRNAALDRQASGELHLSGEEYEDQLRDVKKQLAHSRTLAAAHEKTAQSFSKELKSVQEQLRRSDEELEASNKRHKEQIRKQETSVRERLAQERQRNAANQKLLREEREAREQAEVARKAAVRAVDRAGEQLEEVQGLKQELMKEQAKTARVQDELRACTSQLDGAKGAQDELVGERAKTGRLYEELCQCKKQLSMHGEQEKGKHLGSEAGVVKEKESWDSLHQELTECRGKLERVGELEEQLSRERAKSIQLNAEVCECKNKLASWEQKSSLVQKSFKVKDSDGDGKVTMAELIEADRQLCDELGIPFEIRHVDDCFAKHDKDQDGTLSAEEYVGYMRSVIERGIKAIVADGKEGLSPKSGQIYELTQQLETEKQARLKAEVAQQAAAQAAEAASEQAQDLRLRMQNIKSTQIQALDAEFAMAFTENELEIKIGELLQKQFTLHDVDQDGEISLPELMAADRVFCQAFGLTFSEEQCSASFEQADTNQDGKINFVEFQTYQRHVLSNGLTDARYIIKTLSMTNDALNSTQIKADYIDNEQM